MKQSELPTLTYGVVLPDWRTVVVVTPKAGCTSLLWAMAAAQGEDLSLFRRSLSKEVTRAHTIHDQRSWRRTRSLWQLSGDELAEISPGNGWAIFCLTRDPIHRLWSAWQSKLLLREPLYVEKFGSHDWFPGIPHDADAVADDFRRFVTSLADDHSLARADPHWAPQTEILNVAVMPYTHIGRVETISETLDALEGHLAAQGWVGSLVRLHENRSLLPLSPAFLRPGVVETVADLYRGDYERFGYDPDGHTSGPEAAGGQGLGSAGTLAALRQLIDRHERIGDLQEMALTATDTLTAVRAGCDRLESELTSARAELAQVRSMNGRLRRSLTQLQRSRTLRYTTFLRRECDVLRRYAGLHEPR